MNSNMSFYIPDNINLTEKEYIQLQNLIIKSDYSELTETEQQEYQYLIDKNRNQNIVELNEFDKLSIPTLISEIKNG